MALRLIFTTSTSLFWPTAWLFLSLVLFSITWYLLPKDIRVSREDDHRHLLHYVGEEYVAEVLARRRS